MSNYLFHPFICFSVIGILFFALYIAEQIEKGQ